MTDYLSDVSDENKGYIDFYVEGALMTNVNPDFFDIKVSIDFIKIYFKNKKGTFLRNLFKTSFQYIRTYRADDEEHTTDVYIHNNRKILFCRGHIKRTGGYYRQLKIMQPDLQTQKDVERLLKDNNIEYHLSMFEIAWDIYILNPFIRLDDLQNWVKEHLYQPYVRATNKSFTYKNHNNGSSTFYTRSSRGKSSGNTKVYIRKKKELFNSSNNSNINYNNEAKYYKKNKFIRVEIELKRTKIRKLGLEFPLVNANIDITEYIKFMYFNANKFNTYIFNRYLQEYNYRGKDLISIIFDVKQYTRKWEKYFKDLTAWNDKFQKEFDNYFRERTIENRTLNIMENIFINNINKYVDNIVNKYIFV